MSDAAKKIKILIVEDEAITAKDIEMILKKNGYAVTATANSSKAAMESIAKERPNLLLMDINIKGELDGIETALLINNEYGIPAVFLTAYSDQETLQRVKAGEGIAFVVKPFDETSLITTLDVAFHRWLEKNEVRSFAARDELLLKLINKEHAKNLEIKLLLDQYSGAMDEFAAITVTDKNGDISYANERFLKSTGFTREEVIGRNHRTFNSGYHSLDFFKDLWTTVIAGKVWRGTVRDQGKHGKLVWFETVIVPIKNPEGEVVQFLAFRWDVTEKRHLEDQILLAKKLSTVEQMAANIAHEVNNPLLIILGKTNMLRKSILSDHTDKQKLISIVDKISSTTERMSLVVRTLLKFARKEKDEQVLKYIQVREVVNTVLEFSQDRLLSQSVKVHCDEIPDHLFVYAFPIELSQVLSNLVNNSIDAIGTQDNPWIRIAVEPSDQHVLIKVIDSGTGIPSEISDKIFDAFFTTKTADQGTGLGLSLAKTLLEKQSAKLYLLREAPNTTFVIEYRLADHI